MRIRISGLHLTLLALVVSTIIGTGCATNGRRVLLKEYGPSIAIDSDGPLKGATICLKGFESAPNLVNFDLKTKPEEPKPFTYVKFTREQDQGWDKEMNVLRKQTTKTNWIEIGNLRNGWGMVMSHVYALNDPATWLAEGLKFDLEAQGAKVMDASQAADAAVSLSGTIQLCRLDMYLMIGGDLVVDLDIKPKQGELRHKQIHTHGGTLASMASEGEYFHALREARQKFALVVTHEIAQTLKPTP